MCAASRARPFNDGREDTEPETRDHVIDLPMPQRARYLRVRILHYGKLPAWHPGAGNDAWFFADEIIVR